MFEGFSRELPEFLGSLTANNSKKWFDANRKDYEAVYVEPAKAFVEAMGPALQKLSPGVRAEPRVNGSLMRVNRDTRFSKDKTPYKTTLDIMFTEGEGKMRLCPGFYFRIGADELGMGAGMHGFDPDRLKRYRAAVDADKSGKALDTAIKKTIKATGRELNDPQWKRVPKGFDADHPRADLLRMGGIYVGGYEDLPDELFSKKAVAYCTAYYKKLLPLHQWLVANL